MAISKLCDKYKVQYQDIEEIIRKRDKESKLTEAENLIHPQIKKDIK